MVALTIIAFLVGMTLLGLTLIVVQSIWIVAAVVFVHITGSAVLGTMIIRRLREEEQADGDL